MTLKGGILRFETLGDIDDAEEEHNMILAKKVLGRSKKLISTVGHGYEAKHGKRSRRGKR